MFDTSVKSTIQSTVTSPEMFCVIRQKLFDVVVEPIVAIWSCGGRQISAVEET